jgi:hypothetical protein
MVLRTLVMSALGVLVSCTARVFPPPNAPVISTFWPAGPVRGRAGLAGRCGSRAHAGDETQLGPWPTLAERFKKSIASFMGPA